MGLLEYQAMSSLRDVAHDGWYIYYCISVAGNFSQLGAALVRATGTVRKRQAVWPVHHVQITLLQPARRAAVSGQPSSLAS
jgi:hypothetical protein